MTLPALGISRSFPWSVGLVLVHYKTNIFNSFLKFTQPAFKFLAIAQKGNNDSPNHEEMLFFVVTEEEKKIRESFLTTILPSSLPKYSPSREKPRTFLEWYSELGSW